MLTAETLNLKPRNEWVAVRPIEEDETEGGIALPDTDHSKPGYHRGVVIGIGHEVNQLEENETVVYFSDRSTPVFANGNFILVKQEDILGVFDEE